MQPEADRILVCGFGPFPGVEKNPTTDLVRSLPWRLADFNVHRWVLPVSWRDSGPWLRRRVAAVQPHMLLLTGVGSREGCGQVERAATNELDGKPDARGQMLLPGPIDPRSPRKHRKSCPWPVEDLVEGLVRKAHQVYASEDAGKYLCNHTLYAALDIELEAGSGFLHLRGGGYEGLYDPRRKLLIDLIKSLHIILRMQRESLP